MISAARFFRLLEAAGALWLSACSTDHDLFADTGGSGGEPGTGGRKKGSGGATYSTGGDAAAEANGGTGGRTTRPPEPAGPRKITFVNGVTDAPWISLCFSKVKNGVEGAVGGRPFPPGGLSYANSLTVDAIPGASIESDAVRPYVVAGAPDAISGLDCASLVVIAGAFGGPPDATPASSSDASLDAGSGDGGDASADARSDADGSRDAARSEAGGGPPSPVPVPIPNVRVSALSVIPAGTFNAEEHYLFGLAGCLGGPGIRDPSELSVCGEDFSATNPTLTPVLVTLSRIVTDGYVGLQFVDATPAVRAADLRITWSGVTPVSVVKNVVRGAIRPIPPYAARTTGQLGPSDSDRIQIFADASEKPIYDEPWSKTFAVGGIPAVQNGHDYTLLLIGPYPGFSAREWWNDPSVTIVEN